MKTDLAMIQSAEIDILKKIISICDTYKLRYYAVGGTLLGAVRHRGFIPWDDDIDISMPRPDYEKFLTLADKELLNPYQLNTIEKNQNGFCYYYARAENKSVMLERYKTKKKIIVPVWIDIFPLDGVPDTEKEYDIWVKRGKMYKFLFSASQYSFVAAETYKRKNVIENTLKKIFLMLHIEKIINSKYTWKLLNKHVTKYDYSMSKKVTNYFGRYGKKEMVDKSVFGDGVLLQFEDVKINCPTQYHFYLTQIYGDYMTLPPQKDRVQHNIKMVKN